MLPNDLPVLSEEDKETLIKPLTKWEVYSTLLSMPRGKSPGPYGLNVELYVFYWNYIGDLLFKAIDQFFNSALLSSSWGQTTIVLIPKKDNPILPYDFCPISFCNICYKIITKIFANRFKAVIHKIVGPEQNGFIPGQVTFDNIIAAQEIAYSLEYDFPAHPRMMIKIDIEKAFDSIEWLAILAILR